MPLWFSLSVSIILLFQLVLTFVASVVLGYLLYRFRGAFAGLTEAAKTIQTGQAEWNQVPGVIAGHQRVAQGFLVEIQKLRTAVGKLNHTVTHFSGLIMETTPGDTSRPAPPYNEEEADRQFDVQALLEQRPELGRDQAEALVDSSRQQQLGVD